MHTQTTATTTTFAVSNIGPVDFDRAVELLGQLEERGIILEGVGLPEQEPYEGDCFAAQALRTAVQHLWCIGVGGSNGEAVEIKLDAEMRPTAEIRTDGLAIRLTSVGYLEDWISVVKVEKIN